MSVNAADLVGGGLLVLALISLWLIGRRLGRSPGQGAPRRGRGWRWFIWFGGLLLLSTATAWAQDAPQQAYVTGNPANADWLGLVTLDGRYAIQLGSGCDGVVEGVNVLVMSDGDNLTLQVVDPAQGVLNSVCAVVNIVRTGDLPCETNPDGVCDYAYS